MDVLFTVAGITVALIVLIGVGATLLTSKDFSPERTERRRQRRRV